MLWWFAQTMLIAGGLAGLAALAGRWKRLGPEARHALWLVVLLKLAIPPFVAWPWSLPGAWPVGAEGRVPSATVAAPPAPVEEMPTVVRVPEAPRDAAPALVEVEAGPPVADEPLVGELSKDRNDDDFAEVEPMAVAPAAAPAADAPTPAPPVAEPARPEARARPSIRWTWTSGLLGLWLLSSLVVVVRRGRKVIRFHRSLADAQGVPDWLVEEARAIGERLGVRLPTIVMTSKVGTPLLWCLGRPLLVLPEGLVKRLGADRWAGILAHELAHLARNDHWVVRLELLVEAVWWWNPVFRVARKRVHEEAELACDARVVRACPDRRFAYAEALVDVCEHLSRAAIPAPSLGVGGAGASRSLEGRLLMIVRDPIPQKPTGRAALACLVLVGLALPAWTLGQQPEGLKPPGEPTSPKPQVSPTPAPATPASTPAPTPGEAEALARLKATPLEEVQAGYAKRREQVKNLAARLVTTSRAVGGRPDQPSMARVMVEVADVVYDFTQVETFGMNGLKSRADVFDATGSRLLPPPGGPPPAITWTRRLEIRSFQEIKSIQGQSSENGPSRLRWQAGGAHGALMGGMGGGMAMGGGGRPGGGGYGGMGVQPASVAPPMMMGAGGVGFSPSSLGLALTRSRLMIGTVENTASDYDPQHRRPLSALDLDGPSVTIMSSAVTQMNVAGSEVVGGHPTVRLAWIARSGDVRGLIWLAPALGYAVVRSEAFIDGPRDPNKPDHRSVWRKDADKFTLVGDSWWPTRVTARLSSVGPDGQVEIVNDSVMMLENYRVNAGSVDDAFAADFPIQALDEKTGDFTTTPPAPPAGLLDRLKQAVEQSPFGPPRTEQVAEVKVEGQPDAPPPAPPAPKAAVAPRVVTGTDVIELSQRLVDAKKRLENAQRISRNGSDPAVQSARNLIQTLEAQLADLRAKQPAQLPSQAVDDVELLRIRREGKAAEYRKAEVPVGPARAIVEGYAAGKKAGFVYNPGIFEKAEAALGVAEAELASKKAELDEAEYLLNQARRRQGPTAATAPSVVEASSRATLADLRDEVELMEAQLLGKQAELRAFEAKTRVTQLEQARFQELADRKLVSSSEMVKAKVKAQEAAFEQEQKDLEVRLAEIKVKQAKRRIVDEEARLKAEVARLKSRLDWSVEMFKKGYIVQATVEADRVNYDRAMKLLDPRYVPPDRPKLEPAKPEAESKPVER